MYVCGSNVNTERDKAFEVPTYVYVINIELSISSYIIYKVYVPIKKHYCVFENR